LDFSTLEEQVTAAMDKLVSMKSIMFVHACQPRLQICDFYLWKHVDILHLKPDYQLGFSVPPPPKKKMGEGGGGGWAPIKCLPYKNYISNLLGWQGNQYEN